ncbi:2-succinyl-5-enolpyruvyl-6-hydroxy-3-cyclohexene-1-carboxylic-acid synthase [Paenisporosarcina sp. TG20]|uniref:2-succinyl-5-enolpyruvyl-6-hydroxy-3- cyclohexene-1-carboxylic-acid synthase n=1 Tax=Paenisporosarcina sp. TG20 TaxID=1211706 RepID=UPI0002FCA8C6|nr:2-succinyl-5-enolpyruvyl-6-hydroxy-3-cyclohexene-1-carboxylic-acid synthase [Paenisporosarcina sp. TG20]
MDNSQNLTEYVHTIVQSFLRAGVKDVVISPGSRSTPLAYGFSLTKEFNIYMQIDERSAGFFALGMAKVKNSPVLLLCTSGTAAANYFPAIVEAHYARIPLIVLTADRPHELREVGAPQAIDQVQMYGNHVKWSVDYPLADGNKETTPFVERHTGRAVTLAMSAPMGPIHINIPFREPLLLDFDYKIKSSTYTSSIPGAIIAPQTTVDWVEETIRYTKRGFLIVGELSKSFSKEKFWIFAKSIQWPVLADALSQLRSGVPEDCQHLLIDQYDALLKSENFKEAVNPDVVIRFGAQPVSKPLSIFLKVSRPRVYMAVDEDPLFRDSLGVVTHHIHSSSQVFWKEMFDIQTNETLSIWTQANSLSKQHVEYYIEDQQDEGALVGTLIKHIPDGHDLISGSSMPIRDVDTFFSQTTKDIAIYANRGTNGIDGVVSTALGIQRARNRPATLLIGDISFLHDTNGLLVSRFHETDLTIVVMNNDGGGIFSYLPQASEEIYFEKLFGTPTGLTFEAIANMYQAEYFYVESKQDFQNALTTAKQKDLRIIEVKTNRHDNVIAHRHLWTGITEELDRIWNN